MLSAGFVTTTTGAPQSSGTGVQGAHFAPLKDGTSRRDGLDADTYVAILAATIAAIALWVGYRQMQLTHAHNRKSVQPVLQLRSSFGQGKQAGLRLTNVGLGPAKIVDSNFRVKTDAGALYRDLGQYGKKAVDEARAELGTPRPRATTFGSGAYLANDYDEFLFSIEPYDGDTHRRFAAFITDKLQLTLTYESVYGGERWTATWPQVQQ